MAEAFQNPDLFSGSAVQHPGPRPGGSPRCRTLRARRLAAAAGPVGGAAASTAPAPAARGKII